MADRPLIDRVREALGTKNVKKFFPDPDDPANPLGLEVRFTEYVDIALAWLAEEIQIELVDKTTFVLDATGRLDLSGSSGDSAVDAVAKRIKGIRRIKQGTRFYAQLTTDWSEGTPAPRGSWWLRDRTFYAANMGQNVAPFDMLPSSGWYTTRFTLDQGTFQLKPGAVEIAFVGIPTEDDVTSPRARRALVDYATHLALDDIILRIMRPKDVKLEGVPEIHHNVKDYQAESERRLKLAISAVMDATFAIT